MTYMRASRRMSTEEVARQVTKDQALTSRVVVNATTISKLCKQGKLRAKKVDGKWQIREEDAARVWPGVFDATGSREG